MTWAVPTNVCLPTRASRPDTQRTKRSPQLPLPRPRIVGGEACPDNEVTQSSWRSSRRPSSFDEICQATHEYAFGQRPLFGMTGRLPRCSQHESPGESGGPSRRSGAGVCPLPTRIDFSYLTLWAHRQDHQRGLPGPCWPAWHRRAPPAGGRCRGPMYKACCRGVLRDLLLPNPELSGQGSARDALRYDQSE
jgi:hypothetical protein